MEHENLNNQETDKLGIDTVTCCGFSVGDKVNTPYAGVGIIYKITDDFIHVKHRYRKEGIEWLFTKYLIGLTVYPQLSVSALSHSR